MERYIDADDFQKTMIKRFGGVPCLTDYSEASRYDIPLDDALNLAPTADVVPKSEPLFYTEEEIMKSLKDVGIEVIDKSVCEIKAEVAREIFEEIEAIKCVGVFPYSWVKQFAELKKKYTEGET